MACYVTACNVRTGPRTLRRKPLSSLLLGALGLLSNGISSAGPLNELATDAGTFLSGPLSLRQAQDLLTDHVRDSNKVWQHTGRVIEMSLRLDLNPLSGIDGISQATASGGHLARSRDSVESSPIFYGNHAATVAADDENYGVGEARLIKAVKIAGRLGNQPDEPEQPVPYDPTPGGPARSPSGRDLRENRPAPPKGKDDAPGLPDLSAETWQLAPIRWAGNTSTSGNHFQSGDGSKSLTIFNNLNFQANSFVVAPYIAQWSGMLGASSSGTHFTPTIGAKVRSDSSAMSLGGSVDVFPLSRFPFSANLSRATSMSRSAEISSPSTSTMLGLRQQYRTEDGRDNYSLNFNRNNVTSGTTGTTNGSVLSSFGGSYSTTREVGIGELLEGNHTVSANFGGSNSSSDPSSQSSLLSTSQDSKQFSANINHGWNVHEDLNINNMLTVAKSRLNVFQGNALTQNESTVVLGATGFTWRPFEDLPLTLNGGGNFSRTQTVNNNLSNELSSFGGFVSTNYRFNNNLSASGNLSATLTDTRGVRSTSTVQSGNISYTGDPLSIGGFNYGWGGGSGLSRSSSSTGQSEIGTSLNASHSLARGLLFGEYGTLNLSAGQNISRSSQQQGATTSLSNNAGVAWRTNFGEQLNTNLSANLVYTTSDGVGGRNQFRSANFAGGGMYQLSSRASVTLNANLSWNQSVIGTSSNQIVNGVSVSSNEPTSTGSLSLAYVHRSPFSIKNLNYSGTFMRTQSFSNQNVAGAVTIGSSDRGSSSIQQLADYRIGRLVFRLSHSWIDQAGRKSASIFGSVTREFDGFFDGRW